MASIVKRGDGWRVSVFKRGLRRTATFRTKTEAKLWASQTEIDLEDYKDGSRIPFIDVLERYKREVSIKKRCHYTEKYMLDKIGRAEFSKKPICEITSGDISAWRNELQKSNSVNTVLRAMVVVSHVFRVSVDEWGLVSENPASKVRKPSMDKPRNRRISAQEIQDIAAAFGWDESVGNIQDITTAFQKPEVHATYKDIATRTYKDKGLTGHKGRRPSSQKWFQIGIAFLLAIETGMRQREILDMTWQNIDLVKRTVHLPITKNGDSRDVPLSQTAIRLIKQVRTENEKLFTIKNDYLRTTFRAVVDRLGIKNLHFHDTRHEAVTRLSKKLGVLELAKVIGHKNISQLMTYYNESAEEIAKKLD